MQRSQGFLQLAQRLIFGRLPAVTGAQQVLQARAEVARFQAQAAASAPEVQGAQLCRFAIDLRRSFALGASVGVLLRSTEWEFMV
jgi:hypothetical protein